MLDKFKTFVTLAKYKSFTSTAKHLYCSQPTISQHIKILEKQYAVQLINRENGEVMLTQKGEQFLHYAQSILDLNSNLINKMEEPLKTEQAISIYVSHYLATFFFNELFSKNDIGKKHLYEIRSYGYNELKEKIMNDQTAFAIMPYYEEDEDLATICTTDILFEENFVLAIPNDHSLATRKVIYAKDLNGEKILLPTCVHINHRIRSKIEEKDIFPEYAQMSDFSLIVKGVSQKMGIAFVPNNSTTIHQENIVIRYVKGMTIIRQNAVMIKRGYTLSESEKDYYDALKENMKK
ncbi:LysR family transcriptional regulator [Kurthia sibirica]|uniref:HTH lysR-type domain-containing protein n=1 Tax=Kurthia sibirica TaxID=202750 RepID=A0A2U3AJV5_9BACL|nr:LysR family transcriptional regulator [Kurthia sibirica]PWI24784.1 hypothetical protein DEX24_11715 [Kurthia sibirica]GEK34887.1 hypothetical protein KSI01_24200 [Kurthia sibirica]